MVPQAAAVALPECAEVGKAYTDPSVTHDSSLRASAAECQEACVGEPNCAKMTWFNDSQACWLLTSSAKLRTIQTPADLMYAVSADKICPQTVQKETKISQQSNWATSAANATNDLKNAINGSVLTDAAGAVANREFNAEATAKDAAKGDKEYMGIKWQYLVFGGLGVCLVCSLVSCCFMSGGKSSSKKTSKGRGIKVDEESGRSSRAEEVTPLVSPPPVDAGLRMPQLSVPEIQPARLVPPQLVTVPASAAMTVDARRTSAGTSFCSALHSFHSSRNR
eukprot:TRINITY_DN8381_c0_g1_i1.p1 TRINITY_DN8381_c0_g1~~TRINITY_DN8381_c0_g1_i1.p1  ORF type:complete len:314 (+),score=56.52 TRINITY_DN8381_c0_g1_i1:107-943(+)